MSVETLTGVLFWSFDLLGNFRAACFPFETSSGSLHYCIIIINIIIIITDPSGRPQPLCEIWNLDSVGIFHSCFSPAFSRPGSASARLAMARPPTAALLIALPIPPARDSARVRPNLEPLVL